MPRKRKLPLAKLIIVFVVIIAAVVGFLLIIRHPIVNPLISHQVTYDGSLTTEEKNRLEAYFKENPPSSDFTISASSEIEYNKDQKGTIIYSVSLPVTGFYNPASSITEAEARELGTEETASTETDDTEGLAENFGTCKVALALFNELAYVFALALECFAPVERSGNLS